MSLLNGGFEITNPPLAEMEAKKIISGKRGDWTVLDLQALLKKAEKLLRD